MPIPEHKLPFIHNTDSESMLTVIPEPDSIVLNTEIHDPGKTNPWCRLASVFNQSQEITQPIHEITAKIQLTQPTMKALIATDFDIEAAQRVQEETIHVDAKTYFLPDACQGCAIGNEGPRVVNIGARAFTNMVDTCRSANDVTIDTEPLLHALLEKVLSK